MLTRTRCSLGRWSSLDFMRGRSKKGGAIHIRHTHGSKGRYDRLSAKHGIRDGRRHSGNHMQGGLGIKLGGGLFGLRIPRQHMLSTMTKEQFDLEMHGHPNITNPYREVLELHPDLKSVMANAVLSVKMVIVLPRVKRGTTETTGPVPEEWQTVLKELEKAVEGVPAFAPSSSVTFSTLQSNTECHFGRDWVREAGRKLEELFQDFSDSGHVITPVKKMKKKALFGTAMQTTSLPAGKGHGYRSPSLTQLLGAPSPAAEKCPANVVPVKRQPLQDYVETLRKQHPDALCVCSRGIRVTDQDTTGNARAAAVRLSVRVMKEKLKNKEAAANTRRILKTDIPLDESGVWGERKSGLNDLLRWHYSNHDPRAHSGDAIPHSKREFVVLYLVDLSNNKRYSEKLLSKKPVSLLSQETNEMLKSLSFFPISEESVRQAFDEFSRWSVEKSWVTMLHLKNEKRPSRDQEVEESH
ncbi:hypothetical protein AGDE_07502 [Angomonas deanei]|nr:hypothetical protein AGDE_07502 [Angomonas deanei]|eukprot:EPY35271.1 hypothetical protein AGDE_07502 [Angomonas deanei]